MTHVNVLTKKGVCKSPGRMYTCLKEEAVIPNKKLTSLSTDTADKG